MKFVVPYPPQRLSVMCVAYHHAGFWSRAEFASALNIGDESTSVASVSTKILEWALIRYFIAISIARRFAKSIQHLVWFFVWCFIAIVIIFCFQAFIWWSFMKIDCGIDCFSPEQNGSLGVDHHRQGFFSDCRDHLFSNTVCMVGVWRAWLICSNDGRKDISKGVIVVFSPSIITPESLDLVSHWVYLGLEWLVGGGAGLGFLIWEQPYRFVSRVVIDELYIVSIVSEGRCREGTAHIRMYKFKGLHSVLDWHSNESLLVLGLDADCAHRIIMCISVNQRLHGDRIHMG